MISLSRATLLAILLGPGLVRAAPPDMMDGGPPGGPPGFLRRLFTPKTVMAHQIEIGLRPAQIDAIKRAMNETQRALVDLQWQLDAASEALDKLVAADHVDEAAVLAKLDEVTALERQVKKVNFTLLVRIKNELDPEQQAKLRVLQPPRRGPGGPGGPPPPPPPD